MATTRPIDEAARAAGRLTDGLAVRQMSIVRRTFPLNGQSTSDDLRMYLPSGFRPMRLSLTPSVTLGTATLAIGISGTPAKYRAAATLTAPVGPTILSAAAQAKLAAEEDVIFTIGVASLPASGTLLVEFEGTYD